MKKKNNNSELIISSLATHWFSTLTTVSGDLKAIVSHKNTQYYKLYVYFNLYVYSTRNFSLPYHLQLKCMDLPFFPGHPDIENTTVLCDIFFMYIISIYIYIYLYIYVYS